VARVRGTMKEVPEIEVNIDTVYIRSNIVKIEEEDFSGWEYNEIQYPLREYISKLLDTEVGQLMIAQNTAEILGVITLLNEQQKLEQAQSNAELIELIMSMGGI